MDKNILAEDTVIVIGRAIPLSKYREFFISVAGEVMPGVEFQPWLNTQAGKTLKEALAEYGKAVQRKSMAELMLEERFGCFS